MAKKSFVFSTEFQKYTAARNPLGRGGSGEVFAALGDDGDEYAVKVLALLSFAAR